MECRNFSFELDTNKHTAKLKRILCENNKVVISFFSFKMKEIQNAIIDNI